MAAASCPFFYWLSGFIDGEGTFLISRSVYRRNDGSISVVYAPKFSIKLRDDDVAILHHCVARTGIGKVAPEKRQLRGNEHPVSIWTVASKRDMRRLVEILDAHELLAKKRFDYAVWRQAVLLHQKIARLSKGNKRVHDSLAVLKRRLEQGRKYRHPEQNRNPYCP